MKVVFTSTCKKCPRGTYENGFLFVGIAKRLDERRGELGWFIIRMRIRGSIGSRVVAVFVVVVKKTRSVQVLADL